MIKPALHRWDMDIGGDRQVRSMSRLSPMRVLRDAYSEEDNPGGEEGGQGGLEGGLR